MPIFHSLLLLLFTIAFGANAADLYLLAATAANNLADYPVHLYRVDASSGTAALERDVAKGMSCVLADYVGRRLVIASPGLASNEFSFIDMNAPGSAVTKHLAPYANETLPGRMYLLDLPEAGPGVAFTVEKLDAKANRIE
jgi:hypothetical protein